MISIRNRPFSGISNNREIRTLLSKFSDSHEATTDTHKEIKSARFTDFNLCGVNDGVGGGESTLIQENWLDWATKSRFIKKNVQPHLSNKVYKLCLVETVDSLAGFLPSAFLQAAQNLSPDSSDS
jgi:serine/threonine protein phosphatase PrpC